MKYCNFKTFRIAYSNAQVFTHTVILTFSGIEVTKSQVFTDLSSNIFEPFNSLPSNKSHALTQTGKDCHTEEVQTERGETEEKETQCPHSESTRIEDGIEKERTSTDRARLKKFFFAATQVSYLSLEEESLKVSDNSRNSHQRG